MKVEANRTQYPIYLYGHRYSKATFVEEFAIVVNFREKVHQFLSCRLRRKMRPIDICYQPLRRATECINLIP